MHTIRGATVRWLAVGALVIALGISTSASVSAGEITLTMWSHEASEPAKVAWREMAARTFEKKNPGVKVKITWYEKEALFAALQGGFDGLHLSPLWTTALAMVVLSRMAFGRHYFTG